MAIRCFMFAQVAKVAFQAKKEPLDAALFYLALKKKNVIWGLFRSVSAFSFDSW